jgi:hypothetical protein
LSDPLRGYQRGARLLFGVVVAIETAQGDLAEQSVKRLLEDRLRRYDASRWEFTDRVITR